MLFITKAKEENLLYTIPKHHGNHDKYNDYDNACNSESNNEASFDRLKKTYVYIVHFQLQPDGKHRYVRIIFPCDHLKVFFV